MSLGYVILIDIYQDFYTHEAILRESGRHKYISELLVPTLDSSDP